MNASGTWDRPNPPQPNVEVLDEQLHALLGFAGGSRSPGGGFGSLDADGQLRTDAPVETWISTRMTYCFTLAHLLGDEGAADLVDHGLAALLPGGVLRDDAHGGWFASTADDTKAAYAHAFVVLAAAAAVIAERPHATELLADALAVIEQRFWAEGSGLVRESFSADWSVEEPYRGANATMHSVEAYLAAADALGDEGGAGAVWRARSGQLVEHVVHHVAREASWLLPEHFAPDGMVLSDYNTDDRAHPFRPYGVTPGHLFEWARLAVQQRAAEQAAGEPARDWLLTDAQELYRAAVRVGWARDGADGFVYTTDFDGTPITRARMHWVVTEATAAAAALFQATGDPVYAADHERWWDFALTHLVDRVRGSWHHELDPALQPSGGTWSGKPDVYHALQATLLPRLPLAPMFAAALAARRRG